MPGLPTKAKKKSGKKPSGKKSASKKKSAKSKVASATPSGPPRDVDMMDPAAMYNLYYIAHGAVEALEIRGFSWPGSPKSKKKGKKKKK